MAFIKESDLDNAKYTAADVARATGLSGTLVQQWSNRGLIESLGEKVGSRIFRRYTLLEIMVAAMMARMVGIGVSPVEAREIAKGFQSDAAQFLMPEMFPHTKRNLKTVGNGAWVMIDLHEITANVLAGLDDKDIRLNRPNFGGTFAEAE